MDPFGSIGPPPIDKPDGIRRPSAYVNFFQSLLLLHFLLDSLETRYTYFLDQSPNFVLFRILKFGFSDFFL